VNYLLDTNIISEMQKPDCNEKVKAFTDEIPLENMYISAVSVGELSYGVEKLPIGKKKHELLIWLYTKLPEWFRNRVIPLDIDIMIEWGKVRDRAKRTMPVIDSLIASAAIERHMTLVTRNTKDFEDIEGIMLVNPWEF